jgi:signal transduction histidine kinase
MNLLCFSNKTIRGGVFLLLISATLSFAQTKKIDSLKAVIPKKDGAAKFELLIDLMILYMDLNDTTAMAVAEDGYQVARHLGDTATIVRASRIKTQVLRRFERVKEAIDIGTYALNISRRHGLQKETSKLLNTLAVIYTDKAEYDKALKYHFESLSIREASGNAEGISIVLTNIGLVYYRLGNYKKAKEYYQKSLRIKNRINDTYDLDLLLINLGLMYVNLHQLDSAIDYINKGLNVCGKNCSFQILISSKRVLAMVAEENKKFSETKIYYEEALQIARNSKNRFEQAGILLNLARIHLEMGEAVKALKTLDEVEALTKDSEYDRLIASKYYQYSLLYSKSKDYKNAALYQSKYIELSDSINARNLAQNLASSESEYEQRANLAIIENKEALLQRQQYLSYAIGGIALLLAVLGYVYYRNNRNTSLINKELSVAKVSLEKQNNEIRKVNQDLETLNTEKNNLIGIVAHDLRSPLNQVKVLINVIKLTPGSVSGEAVDCLRMIENSVGILSKMIGKILDVEAIEAKQLNVALERLNFSEEVRSIATRFEMEALQKKIQLHTSIAENVMVMADPTYIDQVLENLLSNAIKFSPPERNIYISISPVSNAALCEIRDEGPGLSDNDKSKLFGKYQRLSAVPTAQEPSTGLGLSIAKKFVDAMQGQIWCESEIGKGASFFIKFNLAA